jgi:hypothetical protein
MSSSDSETEAFSTEEQEDESDEQEELEGESSWTIVEKKSRSPKKVRQSPYKTRPKKPGFTYDSHTDEWLRIKKPF